MTRLAALGIACAVTACGTDDSPGPGMTVSVFKDVPALGCRAQLTSDPLAVAPSQLTFSPCDQDAASELVAGVDQLTLVIDYGALEFAESTDVAPPTVTTLVDGIVVATPVAPVMRRDHSHAFFEVTFAAPARPG